MKTIALVVLSLSLFACGASPVSVPDEDAGVAEDAGSEPDVRVTLPPCFAWGQRPDAGPCVL